MSKKDNNTKPTEDNLNVVDVLTDFNTPKEQEGSEVAEDTVVADSNEATTEQPKETKKQESDRKDAVNYLIENKFTDDEKGKKDLANAYKELQSKSDRERATHTALLARTEKLQALDNYLKNNPDAVKALRSKIQGDKKNASAPPKKPDGYDIMDEAIEGSDSAKWRQANDAWLVNQGKTAANEEINKFKDEMAHREKVQQDTQELKDLGLNEQQMKDFSQFINDPSHMTNANLVTIWKTLTNQKEVPKEVEGGEAVPKKNQQTTAAAVTGSVPPTKSNSQKEVDDFWDGIMGTSNRVYSNNKK